MPAARLSLVRAAEERERRAREDAEVDERRAVLDVPDVELDPFRPWQRGASVHLRPAGDPGLHVEPVPLAVVVLLDLVAERRPRADHAHLAADDVPELRQLVEGQSAEQLADARDPRVAAVDGRAGADRLRADDHRPQLEELELGAVLADPPLPEADGPAVR